MTDLLATPAEDRRGLVSGPDHASLARRLFDAATAQTTIPPLSSELADLSADDAYRIQDELVRLHVEAGATVIGAKLGLTSRAKQVEMDVHEPIWGWLTDRLVLDAGQSFDVASLGQPRMEPEIAFLLGADLEGRAVRSVHVLAATRAVFAAIDILDSRYADYRFTLADVVADNASGGGLALGPAVVAPDGMDLAATGVVLEKNGEIVATAAGAAVLGHPATAVAWLVRRLAATGRGGLRAGQLVLSGGLTAAQRVAPGDVITATFDRLGTVAVSCR